MFELLFKYPATVFSRGQFVFLAPWPVWLLAVAVLAAAGALAWHVLRHHGLLLGARPVVVWLLQTALVALVLFLLWHPAISIATLRPQQNVVAVLMDDSRSMGMPENGSTRLAQAERTARRRLCWRQSQQEISSAAVPVWSESRAHPEPRPVSGTAPATRIGASLEQALAEASSLPLGAVVLLSDGVGQLRRHRLRYHCANSPRACSRSHHWLRTGETLARHRDF